MKRCIETDIVFLVIELLTGDQFRTIEAAKDLIAAAAHVDPDLLSKILLDEGYKPWSRVMSAYVLGFLPVDSTSKHPSALRQALADRNMTIQLRTHAAEALGNLQDEAAVTLLAERLGDDCESKLVRKWCIYALSQLTSAAASAALQRFASTAPQGTLAQELAAVGAHSS